MRKLTPRRVGRLSLLAVLLFAGWVAWRPLADPATAVLLLDDVRQGAEPSILKRLAGEPERTPTAWQVERRSYVGDFYRPGSAPRAALVLVPGAAVAGKDDHRLVAFATTLARVGFAVLVPDLENVKDWQLSADDAGAIADSVLAFGKRPDTLGLPVAVLAISYAVAPAILAAERADVRDRVDAVFGVSGFHDPVAVLRFATTGAYRMPGEVGWRQGHPELSDRWRFVAAFAARLPGPDRDILREIAQRRLSGEPSGRLAEDLGPVGRAVHALADNRDPERTESLVAEMPEDVRRLIAGISLAGHKLHALKARVLLLHGRDDDIIPYSEALAILAAVPPGQGELFLVDRLVHAQASAIGGSDVWAVWRLVRTLLAVRA